MTDLEIEGFHAIVRCKSITKAAEMLFITQPALTRRIQALEQEIGCQLFTRYKGGKKIELTNEGQTFVPIAEKWSMLFQATKDVATVSNHITFTVTTMESINTCIMPPIYRDFMMQCPDTTLILKNQHSAESYKGIEQGLIDLAFIAECQYSKEVEIIPVFREKMYFVCSKNSHYPALVSPDTLDITKSIRVQWSVESDMWYQYWFGNHLQVMAMVEDTLVYETILMQNNTWTVAPASVANFLVKNPNLQILDLSDAPQDRKIYCITDHKKKTEPTEKLLKLVDAHIQNTKGITSMLNTV